MAEKRDLFYLLLFPTYKNIPNFYAGWKITTAYRVSRKRFQYFFRHFLIVFSEIGKDLKNTVFRVIKEIYMWKAGSRKFTRRTCQRELLETSLNIFLHYLFIIFCILSCFLFIYFFGKIKKKCQIV